MSSNYQLHRTVSFPLPAIDGDSTLEDNDSATVIATGDVFQIPRSRKVEGIRIYYQWFGPGGQVNGGSDRGTLDLYVYEVARSPDEATGIENLVDGPVLLAQPQRRAIYLRQIREGRIWVRVDNATPPGGEAPPSTEARIFVGLI